MALLIDILNPNFKKKYNLIYMMINYKDKYLKYKKKYLKAKEIYGGLLVEKKNCKGENILNTDECTDPEFPCVTPTLRCASLENNGLNGIGIKNVVKSLQIDLGEDFHNQINLNNNTFPVREEINFEEIKNRIFTEEEKEKYILRLFPESEHNFNNIFRIGKFIGCGSYACVYEINDLDNNPIDKYIRLSIDSKTEYDGLKIQYKVNNCPYVNKLHSYGIYKLEKFDDNTNRYVNSNELVDPLNCKIDNQTINNCKNRQLTGLFGIIDPCKGGELFYKIDIYDSEVKIKELIKNILLGLKCIHDNNLIHMDLKPENIGLVNEISSGNLSSNINILDFGLSVDLSKVQQIPARGTFNYSPPELLSDSLLSIQKRSKKIDIFSLGAILFAILYHDIPRSVNFKRVDLKFFYSRETQRILVKKNDKDNREPIKRWIDNEIYDFIKKNKKNIIEFMLLCLENDPRNRLSVDQALAHPWLK